MVFGFTFILGVVSLVSGASIGLNDQLLHKDWVTDIPVVFKGDRKTTLKHFPVVNVGITTEDKQTIVDIHNKYRRIIAQNATNMMKLYWDDELAKTAQQHADSCHIWHDKLHTRRPLSIPGVYVGQNMCSGSQSWEDCVKQWYDELSNYAYGFGTKTLTWTDIGHFTQLASWHITKVGCGYAECEGQDRTSMVCNYAYGQYQYDIQRPWKSGPQCGDCPNNCNNGLCDCGNMLCNNFGVLDVNTCSCTCLPFYTGSTCEQVLCSEIEDSSCAFQSQHDCKSGVNIAAICPNACSRCP